jgi:hypothetical protein
MLPPLDHRGAGLPATWIAPNPCRPCKGVGYQKATPIGIVSHLKGTGFVLVLDEPLQAECRV